MKHLYIILFILPLIVFGQGWEQTYPGHMWNFNTVSQTSDGGYITGISSGIEWESQDLSLLKLDENGNEEWSSNLFITDNICSYFGIIVEEDMDGGYVGCLYGSCYSNPTISPQTIDNLGLIFKTDEYGNVSWTQTTDLNLQFMSQTNDGDYIFLGSFYNYETTINSVTVMKISNNGDEVWSQDFEGSLINYLPGSSLQETNDGGYFFVMEESTNNDIKFIKLDQMGNVEWENDFIEFNTMSIWGQIVVDNSLDGGCVSGGVRYDYDENLSLYYVEMILIKTDENGNQEWMVTNQLEDLYSLQMGDIQSTIDGGYIIVGQTGSTWDSNIILIKTDENGNEEWTQMYGNNDGNWGVSVRETSDGGYVIGGTKEVIHEMEYVMYLIKTDGQGNVTSTIEIPKPTSKRELVKTTNILGQENITIKNQPMIEIYDDGSTEKKIVLE